jgi:hypothetical protein
MRRRRRRRRRSRRRRRRRIIMMMTTTMLVTTDLQQCLCAVSYGRRGDAGIKGTDATVAEPTVCCRAA